MNILLLNLSKDIFFRDFDLEKSEHGPALKFKTRYL